MLSFWKCWKFSVFLSCIQFQRCSHQNVSNCILKQVQITVCNLCLNKVDSQVAMLGFKLIIFWIQNNLVTQYVYFFLLVCLYSLTIQAKSFADVAQPYWIHHSHCGRERATSAESWQSSLFCESVNYYFMTICEVAIIPRSTLYFCFHHCVPTNQPFKIP